MVCVSVLKVPTTILFFQNYISPEVLANNSPIDGFAIDLWASGVVLFIMLVGIPPFSWADLGDSRFRCISEGGLDYMLKKWNDPISPLATDLLQSMLRRDPQDRLTLFQVMNHPWVLMEDNTRANGNGHSSLAEAIERMTPPEVGEVSDDSSNESMSEEA